MSKITKKIVGETAKLTSKALPYRKFSGESLVPAELHIESLKLMSYNILADTLVARHMYKPADAKFIPIDQRVNKILKEIDILEPDIVLFQEKQKGEDKSVGMLKERGYEVALYD